MSNQKTPPKQGTILIVDDNPDNLHLLFHILTKQGYRVRVANRGEQAIKSAQSSPPDLILLDIIMPEMDGYEVCKYLKASEQLRDIPVIFISALGSVEDKVNAFAVGGVDYVIKPFHTEEVLARVKMHLALQNAHKQLEGKNRQLEQEIVARQRTEDALQKSNERFRSLVETTSDWIWEIDQNRVYTYVSPKISDLLGHEPDEVIGKTPFDLMPADEAERVAALFDEIVISRKPFENLENVHLHKDGKRVILESSGVPIFDEKGNLLGYRGVDRDITERVRSEKALWESETRYRNIFARVDDVIYETDFHGHIIGISPSIEKQSGYRPDELIGKSVVDFYPYPDEYAALWAAMEGTGTVRDFEIHLKKKNGDIRFVSITAYVVFDEDGQPVKTEGVLRDITERKRAENEVRKLNEELEQRVQRRTSELETANREMDSFQYSASHDLRTPLRGIDGFAHILLEDYADILDDTAENYLQSIRRSAQRMGEIIDDMLRMSRITQHKMYISEIDMTSIVEYFAKEYQEKEPQREMEFTIAKDIHAIGDEYLISIALENLIGNAVKFTHHREITRITFGNLEIEGKTVFLIQDNGAGFNMEYKGKLFTAFQRLHRQDQFEGSGVGLAIVNRIIARHKGQLWAESEEGEGATFYFTIGLQPS